MIRRWVGAGLGILLSMGLASAVYWLVPRIPEASFRPELDNQVQRQAAVLQNLLLSGKEMGATILAGKLNNEIRSAAQSTPSQSDLLANPAQSALRVLANTTEANDALVANQDGDITGIDRSKDKTRLGENIAHYGYFQTVMQGKENLVALLNPQSGARELYMAAPVYRDREDGRSVVGSVIVQFAMAEVDDYLGRWPEYVSLLMSPDGVVVASNKPAWLLHTVGPLSSERQAALQATGLYGQLFATGRQPATLPSFHEQALSLAGRDYLVSRASINWHDPRGPLHLVVLADRAPLMSWPVRIGCALLTWVFGLLLVGWWWHIARSRARELAHAQALDDQLALQQSLIDAIPNPLFYKDSQGRYLGFNQAYVQDLGVDPETLLGLRVSESPSLPASERDRYQAESEQVMQSGELLSRETSLTLADGQTHDMLFKLSRYHLANGQPGGVVGTLVDVTPLKMAEHAMAEARQTAEEATRAKSHFLANMSHEIRTPMNAIIGMTHLALQTALDGRQRGYLERIDKASNHLLGIINDILDFSKIEAGKMTLEQIPFDLEAIFDNLASLLGFRAEEKGLELLFDLMPGLPTQLIGDPLRLEQILLNLGNNAVKFTEQGNIIIQARLSSPEDLPSDTAHAGLRLQFCVQDSGIGMTEAQCARLFSSFAQADASTTRRYGGTGLGLAISRNLVNLMQGNIWVASTPETGSRFYFDVLLAAQPQQPKPRMLREDELDGVRTLVVDDNPLARDILAAQAAHLGLAVTCAADGRAALQCLQQAEADAQPFVLALVDWKMPEMDGLALLQAMQSLKHPPVSVMVTAYGQDELLLATAAAGMPACEVLIKPVTPSRLLETVGQLLGQMPRPRRRRVNRAVQYQAARQQLQGARLLLVEDNLMNRELAVELLESAGIKLVCAEDGQQALTILQQDRHFDGILMDCQMPVMDGYAATRQLRLDPAWRQIPVIALTANAMSGDREKALAAGMNDHLSKPLNVAALFTTLARWIRPQADAQMGRDNVPSGDLIAGAPIAQPSQANDLSAWGLPGVDIAAGMQSMDGDQELYVRMWRRFRSSADELLTQAQQALAQADIDSLMRAAHTLKGLAGSMGALSLQSAAKRLEQHAQGVNAAELTLDTLQQLLNECVQVWTPLAAALDQAGWLPTAAVEDEIAPDLTCRPWWQLGMQLQSLLLQSDAQALTVGEALAQALQGTEDEPHFRPIHNALICCDFDAALSLLHPLVQRWQRTLGEDGGNE